MDKWQLHDAKNKLSYLIDIAMAGKPQLITRRGDDAVVMMSASEYKKITKPKIGLNKFLLQGPKLDDLEIIRVVGRVRGEDL